MNPSGEQYAIEGAGYSAVVTEVGATLRELRHEGRRIIAGFDVDELRPVYRGAILAPWPNRIADGSYEFGGARHHLPISEPARNNALHGLVAWSAWQPHAHDTASVTLRHRLHARDGYPFQLDFELSYTLGADGLSCRLIASNSGDVDAPYGCASHCYLVAGSGHVDDWTFELGAEQYLEVTADRLLPIETRPAVGTPFDFRSPRAIGDLFIDHAFTELGGEGKAFARLVAADGEGVQISWDNTHRWVQVHTADRPEPHLNRSGLAVEPMTCPPDAFNSGTDLVVIPPGGQFAANWSIAAI